jgi:pimeloyl-ACP methyl ester carboxylesterase
VTPIRHRTVRVDDLDLFYREAGPPDGPVVLLPHGYPCSSFQFRGLMAELSGPFRTVAPDLPGFGYSGTPAAGTYGFRGYGEVLGRFAEALGLERYALYLHDYGSQFGLELALAHPERVSALVVQNGDVHEDCFGPKYAALQEFWAAPSPEGREALAAGVSLEGFRDEFVGEVSPEVAERVSPDLWTLHWRLMDTPERRENVVRLFEDQANTLDRFAVQREYLGRHRPPTLVVWGPQDGYMPAEAARAYLRELPDAELHLVPDGGHWLLETHLDVVAPLVRDFLLRTLG